MSTKFIVRRNLQVIVLTFLILLPLSTMAEAGQLWLLLEGRVASAAGNQVSEPFILVAFATAMAWSARHLRRRPSID